MAGDVLSCPVCKKISTRRTPTLPLRAIVTLPVIFYTFTEALNNRTTDIDDDSFYAYRNTNNRRSRLQVNISQNLNELGSFYLSGYQQDYWGLQGYERTLTIGYNQSWERIRFMLNYSLTQTPTSNRDEQISFTVSIPLDKWLPNAWANYTWTDNRHQSQQHQIGA